MACVNKIIILHLDILLSHKNLKFILVLLKVPNKYNISTINASTCFDLYS